MYIRHSYDTRIAALVFISARQAQAALPRQWNSS